MNADLNELIKKAAECWTKFAEQGFVHAQYNSGYIVVDSNFNRVKIKSPAYVAVFHLKNKSNKRAYKGA